MSDRPEEGSAEAIKSESEHKQRVRRRAASTQRTQREVALKLGLSLIAFVIVTSLLALISVYPRGPMTQRAIRPVLEDYMLAADQDNAAAAHRLYSRAGMRATSIEQVEDVLADRYLYDGFESLSILDIQPLTVPDGNISHAAQVQARLRFTAGPPGQLVASLEREDEAWRISSISVDR